MAHGHPSGRGIWKHKAGSSGANPANVKVADVSYQNDELAALIVRAWNDQPAGFRNSLLVGTPLQRMTAAQAALQGLPIHPIGLASPIVITEDEYETGFSLANAGLSVADGVVFVVPRDTRPTTTGGPPLLETAKMLMAITRAVSPSMEACELTYLERQTQV